MIISNMLKQIYHIYQASPNLKIAKRLLVRRLIEKVYISEGIKLRIRPCLLFNLYFWTYIEQNFYLNTQLYKNSCL